MFIYHLSITIRPSLFCKGKQFCGNPQTIQKEFDSTRTPTNANRACREHSRQTRLLLSTFCFSEAPLLSAFFFLL
jgi:hypothetical protein